MVFREVLKSFVGEGVEGLWVFVGVCSSFQFFWVFF